MADRFRFELVTPERLLIDMAAAHVVVPGEDGEFGVLPGHAPLMSTLRPGIVSVEEHEGDTPRRLFVPGGFAEVTAERLTLLAEDAIDPASVDAADLERRIRDAEEDATEAKDEVTRHRAEDSLLWMRALREEIAR